MAETKVKVKDAIKEKLNIEVDIERAQAAGKSAYFILDRLIIRDKPSGSSND